MIRTIGNPSVRYGDQTIVNGNIVIGTSGKGVDFSADGHAAGMTSELLDDYEEGTWTPVVFGLTTAGVGTYVVQSGRYTKIGRTVFYDAIVQISAHTGTGNMRISGLPFNVAATNYPPASVVLQNITLTANNFPVGYPLAGSSLFQLAQLPVGTAGAIALIPMDTAFQLFISGHYDT